MKKVRFIAWILVFALLLGMFQSMATNQPKKIDVGKLIREIEQRKQNPITLFPDDEEWTTETKEALTIVEKRGDKPFSKLPKEEQSKVLSYLDASAEEMLFFEKANLDTGRSMSCIFVMREAVLTAEEVLTAQTYYEQVEDVIPVIKQLEEFSMLVEMTEEQYVDLKNRILHGASLSEAVEASGYDFTVTLTDPTPEPVVIDLSYIAPYSLHSGNEQISLNTGSLTYAIPIVHIPGVNGLNVDLSILYNSSDAAQYVPEVDFEIITNYFIIVKEVVGVYIYIDGVLDWSYTRDKSPYYIILCDTEQEANDLAYQLQNTYGQLVKTDDRIEMLYLIGKQRVIHIRELA